ncbi:uncharacterized protein H6S33_003071 [Morchella sextelata]|uniref:uncharacterized protein n=1 Tax=Morchella sextelata TaxID=1174677 RepID=UPI001D0425DC|nr:uncharacterized protein H6S33_003071 [Morchella sextelata]KAH0607083.1 hypothetical protein H6S33_003071 [Morchella sextelata]
MCQGQSSRTSFGGAVARIHPTGTNSFSCLLQFKNGAGHSDPTILTYEFERLQLPCCKLRIHQFGDLSSSVASAGRILHSVDLMFPSAEKTAGSVVLDRRLDLGVGEEGIIGRVVSVTTTAPAAAAAAAPRARASDLYDEGSESEEDPEGLSVLLGEGVIGWN